MKNLIIGGLIGLLAEGVVIAMIVLLMRGC